MAKSINFKSTFQNQPDLFREISQIYVDEGVLKLQALKVWLKRKTFKSNIFAMKYDLKQYIEWIMKARSPLNACFLQI